MHMNEQYIIFILLDFSHSLAGKKDYLECFAIPIIIYSPLAVGPSKLRRCIILQKEACIENCCGKCISFDLGNPHNPTNPGRKVGTPARPCTSQGTFRLWNAFSSIKSSDIREITTDLETDLWTRKRSKPIKIQTCITPISKILLNMSQKQWAEVKADSLPSSFWDACCFADVMQSIRAFGMLEVCRWKIMISFIWYHFSSFCTHMLPIIGWQKYGCIKNLWFVGKLYILTISSGVVQLEQKPFTVP